MKVVTFSIFKGGTAKTTSTVNTAAALANKGKSVLVIDLDQQASATRYLDLDPDASPNLYEVFMGTQQAPLAIRKTKHGVDVLSSHVLMAAIEEALGLGAAALNPIPASAERMAVDGVADLINHLQRIMWNKFNLTHQELRILFTMYRSTTNHSPAIVENARKIWRDNILNVKIPHSTIFARSYDEKIPVYKLDSHHPGAIAYDVLADWLIAYNNENA